ncbi:FAD-dependent oxidoreductase [Acidobacteria bacterium Mor1]|nr:FAD-dependent oxidoreductase [Acidobacteria bacterium Mor1]
MMRREMASRLAERDRPWDIAIVGGGATGLGGAVDAASRGYDVVLFEQSDFGKGTSSRSTKLVHGGVRYLQQGNVSLVMEALKERGVMRQLAPHLVDDLAFIVPSYEWWESPFYGVGLKVYDLLAGKYGFGKSKMLSKEEVVAEIPTIATEGLRGGIRYYDGQFDDARLAINLAGTAAEQGATLLNYAQVTALHKDESGRVDGLTVCDLERGEEHRVAAKVVINATGPFSDGLRKMDNPDAPAMISPSQGVHLVLDRSFIPGEAAIMVPHTSDGRVMFAIPWHHVAVVGTTDTPIDQCDLEPVPMESEIEFILENANRYLSRPATRADIKSVFAGIRPLVKAADADTTSSLSRDHTIFIDPLSGLVTIAGGKWTTYRKMAEDLIDQASLFAGLDSFPCVTEQLSIHGNHQRAEKFGRLAVYGSDAIPIQTLIESDPAYAAPVHPRLELTAGEILWFARHEMARTVDDVLSRRSRSLLFDAVAAWEAAPKVAEVLALELGRSPEWATGQIAAFRRIAEGYFGEPGAAQASGAS